MDYLVTIYIIICYFVSVLGGFLPFFIKLLPNKKLAATILDVASAAAGGLFLSGGLMHMLAEANEMIEESGLITFHFPLSFFCCGSVFLIVFFFDRVVATHAHSSFSDLDDSYADWMIT